MRFEHWLHVTAAHVALAVAPPRGRAASSTTRSSTTWRRRSRSTMARGDRSRRGRRAVRARLRRRRAGQGACRDARGTSCSSRRSCRTCATARGRCCAARLHRRRRPHARARHRRHHRGLQPRRRHPADAAAVSGAGRLVSVNGVVPGGGLAAMRDDGRRWTSPPTPTASVHADRRRRAGVRVTGTRVSAELFSILGVTPALGRWLRAGEDQAPRDRFVILSHALWAHALRRATRASSAGPSSSTASRARSSA